MENIAWLRIAGNVEVFIDHVNIDWFTGVRDDY